MSAIPGTVARAPQRSGEVALLLLRAGLVGCALALLGSFGIVLWRIVAS